MFDKRDLGFSCCKLCRECHKRLLLAIINILPLKNTIYTAAIKRKYEGLRRVWLLEGKENYEETVESVSKAKRYRARRQRVSMDPLLITFVYFKKLLIHKYDNRSSVVSQEEQKNWKEIDQRYMTEESDCENGKMIIEHKLPWRSQRKFIINSFLL